VSRAERERRRATEREAAKPVTVTEAVLGDLRALRDALASDIGTTNAACPLEPSSRSTDAITTCTSEMPPLVAHAFWPLSTHSPAA
jgi:hypothetical protein